MAARRECSGHTFGLLLDSPLLSCPWRKWRRCERATRVILSLCQVTKSNRLQGAHIWGTISLGFRARASRISEHSQLHHRSVRPKVMWSNQDSWSGNARLVVDHVVASRRRRRRCARGHYCSEPNRSKSTLVQSARIAGDFIRDFRDIHRVLHQRLGSESIIARTERFFHCACVEFRRGDDYSVGDGEDPVGKSGFHSVWKLCWVGFHGSEPHGGSSQRRLPDSLYVDLASWFFVGPIQFYRIRWLSSSFRTNPSLSASDAAAHMSEEVEEASLTVPRAMMTSFIVSSLTGLVSLVSFLFCIPGVSDALNDSTGYPFLYVLHLSMPDEAVNGITVVMLLLVLAAVINSDASASRQIFAFARDRGLPFSGWISRVSYLFDYILLLSIKLLIARYISRPSAV